MRIPSNARVHLALLPLLLMTSTRTAAGNSTESVAPETGGWHELPALPETQGFAGAFAGEVGDGIFLAGGTNFVGGLPWTGGTKTWHDTIYHFSNEANEWSISGRLPHSLAYGASVSWHSAVIAIGGCDATHHYAEVYRFTSCQGQIAREECPPLPEPSAYHSAVICDGVLYVLGGQRSPDDMQSRRGGWRLDLRLEGAHWETVAPWPGAGRLMSVAGCLNGAVYIIGGYDIHPGSTGAVERTFLRDAWRLGPDGQWNRCSTVPHPVVGTPSPALSDTGGRLILFGWNDGKIGAIEPPDSRPDFPADILVYDTTRDKWEVAGQLPFPGKVTPLIPWRGGCAVVSGEIQPGIRTPRAWVLPAGKVKQLFGKNEGEAR